MRIFLEEKNGVAISNDQIRNAVLESIKGLKLGQVLLIPPDFTRFYSNAGFTTNAYYHALKDTCTVDILPALGTHVPMTDTELTEMFGDIPHDRFFEHKFREDVVDVGVVPGEFISQITEGIWTEDIRCQINKRVLDDYDLIVSIGQVVPHEVVGMANHAKNLFVGCGGSEFINKSHMVGAMYGMERIMGKDHTPPRRIFDYAFENCALKSIHGELDFHLLPDIADISFVDGNPNLHLFEIFGNKEDAGDAHIGDHRLTDAHPAVDDDTVHRTGDNAVIHIALGFDKRRFRDSKLSLRPLESGIGGGAIRQRSDIR